MNKSTQNIIIANITAVVCFIMLGALCLFVAAYSIVMSYGLLGETTPQEVIVTYIVSAIIAFVVAYVATKAGLFIIKRSHKKSALSISIILPMMFLFIYIWNIKPWNESKLDNIINLLLIPILIFLSSYIAGKLFIKNNRNLLKVED